MSRRLRHALAAGAMLLGLAFAGSAPAQAAAARRSGWTSHVAVTPTGSFVLGNPQAKVKLVEYMSMTCSHCAEFSQQAMPALKRDYIATGLVSLEIRNAVRDAYDLAGVLVARCAGPKGYFPTSEALLAAQPDWMARAAAFAQAQGDALKAMPLDQALLATARGVGFDRLASRHGVAARRVATCLADKAEQDTVAAMARDAWGERRISGTPYFLINGVAAEGVTAWQALEPALRAALDGR